MFLISVHLIAVQLANIEKLCTHLRISHKLPLEIKERTFSSDNQFQVPELYLSVDCFALLHSYWSNWSRTDVADFKFQNHKIMYNFYVSISTTVFSLDVSDLAAKLSALFLPIRIVEWMYGFFLKFDFSFSCAISSARAATFGCHVGIRAHRTESMWGEEVQDSDFRSLNIDLILLLIVRFLITLLL